MKKYGSQRWWFNRTLDNVVQASLIVLLLLAVAPLVWGRDGAEGSRVEGKAGECSNPNAASGSASRNQTEACASRELMSLGARGALISRAREQVLEILETPNRCSAWFRETSPGAAEVFSSLHYELDENGTSTVYRMRDDLGTSVDKHPWGAKSFEYAGRGSTITINSNGPFFVHESRLSQLDPRGGSASPTGWSLVMVGPYPGDTAKARIVILLHELGHITGRLPMDDGSWNGGSARNTVEVLQHCKREIHLMAKKAARAGHGN